MSTYHKLTGVERVLHSKEAILSIPKNRNRLKAVARIELMAMLREIRRRRQESPTKLAVLSPEEEATGRLLVLIFKAAILADKLAEPGPAPAERAPSLEAVSTEALKRLLSSGEKS